MKAKMDKSLLGTFLLISIDTIYFVALFCGFYVLTLQLEVNRPEVTYQILDPKAFVKAFLCLIVFVRMLIMAVLNCGLFRESRTRDSGILAGIYSFSFVNATIFFHLGPWHELRLLFIASITAPMIFCILTILLCKKDLRLKESNH